MALSRTKKGLIVVFVLISLLGTYMTYDNYTTAQNRIDEAEAVKGNVVDNGMDWDFNEVRKSEGLDYDVQITYNYTVGGEAYTNDYITPLSRDVTVESSDDAERYLEEYKTGSVIEVYYMPGDPSVSFLTKKTPEILESVMIVFSFLIAALVVPFIDLDE